MTSTLPQNIYLAQAFLESEGIPTLLQDELTTQVHNFYSHAIGGVKMLVPASEAVRAVRLLTEAGYIDPTHTPSVPTETIRTLDRAHCPYCGSEDIRKQKRGNWLMLVFYAVLGVPFPLFKTVFLCFDCGKTWKFRKP